MEKRKALNIALGLFIAACVAALIAIPILLPKKCQNGGVKHAYSGNRTDWIGKDLCLCANGFFGLKYSEEDTCKNKKCANGGICRVDGDTGKEKCECVNGGFGELCELENPCWTKTCEKNQVCVIGKEEAVQCISEEIRFKNKFDGYDMYSPKVRSERMLYSFPDIHRMKLRSVEDKMNQRFKIETNGCNGEEDCVASYRRDQNGQMSYLHTIVEGKHYDYDKWGNIFKIKYAYSTNKRTFYYIRTDDQSQRSLAGRDEQEAAFDYVMVQNTTFHNTDSCDRFLWELLP